RVEKVYDNDFVPTGDKKRMELFLKSQVGYYLFSKMYEEAVVPLKQVPDGAIPKIARIGNVCFYLGVLIEVIIMFLGKAQFTNPYEGLMFRIPFVLFAIKVLCTRYSWRDIIAMVIVGGVAVISYLTNTKDELVRFAVFLFAMKDINLKNVLIWVYKLSVAFMILLALLSMTGILGTVFERYEGYGFKEGRWRLCLGVGNSNSLAVMIWALMLLGIYLYHEKMRWVHYLILTVLSVAVYYTTLTRTTLAVMILTVLGAFILQNCKAVRESKHIYFLGGILILAFLGFSIWSACVSDWHEFMDPEVVKISNLLTGRIESLSRFTDGGGHISNWTYFSAPEHDRYFDMGYVRFFYWYGIIPGALAIILVLSSIRESYKRHDYMGFLMIMMFGLFTVVEAHIVSVYIARNYLLFLIGGYLVTMLRTGSYNKPKEAYFWIIPIEIFGGSNE
ncbi:MAG: hypothetical protein K6G12_11135, partial [Lachnospiraceae bacterium]|nr:hypothetical protein [Lachnospiraceae bacterium]